MSTSLKRKQKNNEVKHSIRMINQLDTENDIQINENVDTFNNKKNYLDGANQLKNSNEEYIKIIKADNRSKNVFQSSYDLSLNSPNFNKQSIVNNPNNVSQSQGFLNKLNKNTSNANNYQNYIYSISKGIDNLSENLNKDFEEIENMIEHTIDDLKNKPNIK